MPRIALQALDIGFLVFHTTLVIFNVLGWLWPRTRRLNLFTLTLTAASWFVMGLWHGVGYCVCTDWHWQVRQALGYHDNAQTYIQFLVQQLSGESVPANLVRTVSGWGFGISVVGSVALNVRDWRRRRIPELSTKSAK